MDWKTSLDWYCSGNTLEEEDFNLLEKYYVKVTTKTDTDQLFEQAPKHICNQAETPEGSPWITVLAVVLDRLNPVKTGKPRSLIIDELLGKKSS